MDEKGTLLETFAIVEPTEEVNWGLLVLAYLGVAFIFLAIAFIYTFFFVVFFTTINVIFVLTDQLGHRLKVMIEPLGILILGVGNQLNTDFGGHALKVVGTCSIVILIALIWAGRVTRRGALKAVCTFLSLAAIFVFAGAACEFYLLLDSGPSKLRNKMLSILGYEIAALYLTFALVSVRILGDYYKKEQAEGRPVPWIISNVTAFIGILVKNYYPSKCFMLASGQW